MNSCFRVGMLSWYSTSLPQGHEINQTTLSHSSVNCTGASLSFTTAMRRLLLGVGNHPHLDDLFIMTVQANVPSHVHMRMELEFTHSGGFVGTRGLVLSTMAWEGRNPVFQHKGQQHLSHWGEHWRKASPSKCFRFPLFQSYLFMINIFVVGAPRGHVGWGPLW